jgi:hypothetical protein
MLFDHPFGSSNRHPEEADVSDFEGDLFLIVGNCNNDRKMIAAVKTGIAEIALRASTGIVARSIHNF